MEKLSNNEFLKLKKLLTKKWRQKEMMFLIEGHHLVNEALKSNNIKFIVTSDYNYRNTNILIKYCSQEKINSLSTTKTSQNILGVCHFFKPKKLGNQILLLNNINDPGNLGTLIRTACAFGMTDVIVEGVDIYNSKVIRSTQGAIFKINIANINDSELFLKKMQNTHSIIGTILDKQAKKCEDIKPYVKNNFIIILGNESNGLNSNLYKYLDFKVYIPIKFESLNVAIAGSIVIEKLTN